MTWTVTALGTAVSGSGFATPVTSITLTPSGGVAAGAGVAVFAQYTDSVTDAITVTDSASNSGWSATPVDTLVDATTGQGLASIVNLSLPNAITTITVHFGSATLQSFGAISFTNSVSGTPTLDGHSGHDNSTLTTTPNSGAGNSTNGDLVLTGIVSNGTNGIGATPSLAITGVTTTTVRNNQNTVAGYADASGVTTTGGAGSVTSTWTVTSNTDVVLELIFKPPTVAAACLHTLATMGVGCSLGWRATLLGGGAWRTARAIERNGIMTRRRLILPAGIGHNGGPKLGD